MLLKVSMDSVSFIGSNVSFFHAVLLTLCSDSTERSEGSDGSFSSP